MPRIPTEAPEFYHQNGYYLFHEPVFPQQKFDRLTNIFEELLANATVRPDKLDTPILRAENFKIWHCRGKNQHNNPVVN